MNELNLGKNITKYRRNLGMTQEELASYMGVSKSSVSKWENSSTYPDILLLPELATLFCVSLDELIGYNPQLTKEKIKSIYYELADDFTKDTPYNAFKKSEDYIKKYYSCFEFLEQMVVLYLNHFMLFENKDEILNKALSLCKRIKEESNNAKLIKEIISLEATALIMSNKPVEVLELLGEEVNYFFPDATMIGKSFSMLGNQEKAREVIQISMYQNFMNFMGNIIEYISLNKNNLDLIEEIEKRVITICDLFNLDELHPNTALNLYLIIAQVYALNERNSKALDMIERYEKVVREEKNMFELRGDEFFDKVEDWFKKLDLGVKPPRSIKLIKESLVASIKENPAFINLKEEARFKACILSLENI